MSRTASETAPEIAVIIPHLNDAGRLGKCLDALAGQTFDMSRAEILVVDNGSRELPHAVTARFPNVRLLQESIPGPGPARNRGAAETRAPLLAFTDSDCIPDPGWIAAIMARFRDNPGIEALGGEIRITIAREGAPSKAEAFELLYGFRQRMQIPRLHFSASANLVIRRDVFAAVGPFGGLDVPEDLDWGQRAHAKGFTTIYAPEAVVCHPAREDMQGLYRQWSRHVSHHFHLYALDRPGGRLKWALKIPAMAVSPIAEIPAILRSDRLEGAGQRFLAFHSVVNVRLFRASEMLKALLSPGGRSGNTRWNRS